MITIVLTDEQAEFLQQTLSSVTDCGPEDEGWASAELEEICGLVRAAITEQRAAK